MCVSVIAGNLEQVKKPFLCLPLDPQAPIHFHGEPGDLLHSPVPDKKEAGLIHALAAVMTEVFNWHPGLVQAPRRVPYAPGRLVAAGVQEAVRAPPDVGEV